VQGMVSLGGQQLSRSSGAVPVVPVAMCAPQKEQHPALSARQRKQVYMHSAIFDAGGAPQQSVYSTARQTDVFGGIRQTLSTPAVEPQRLFPSPADLRVTANKGQGVLHGTCGHTNESAKENEKTANFFHFGNSKEQIRVIHADRSRDAIPQEFKSTETKIHWTDARTEHVHARTQEFFAARQGMDASSLKRQELSSEVFGSTRRLEPSTASPSKEICSVGMRNVHNTDSTLDHTVPKEPENVCLSARDRLSKNLYVSSTSQFDSKDAGRKQHASASPLRDWRTGVTQDGDQSAQRRRRTERNYSDLFGVPSPREAATRAPRAARRSSPEAVEGEALVYRPAPRVAAQQKSPAEQKFQSEERACWDTRHGMDAKNEIARRRRERSSQPSGAQQRERSASERKRLELASGQFRTGTGAAPEPYDDCAFRPAAPVGQGSKPPDSPGGRGFPPDVRPDSARGRKVLSLTSSIF